MTKYEYLAKLEQLLSSLPEQERRDAMNYYEEYFVSAGPEKEAEAIRELGTPEEAARKILEGSDAVPPESGAPAYTAQPAAAAPRHGRIPTALWVVLGVVVGLVVLFGLLVALGGLVFARSTTASTEVVGSGSSIVLPQPTAPADPAAQSGSSSTGETGAVTGTADNWQTSLGSNLRKLDLKVNNGDLALVLDPAATEFTLQVNGLDQSILRTRADDGGLNVQLGPQGNQQGHLFTATLTIPDTGVLQDLDVSLNSADLDLPDMTLDELEITLNAGDVQAGEISARSISLETNAGNIYAAACQADEVSLETNAGRIEAARVQPGRELEVSSNAGEITASLTGTASDYTLQAEVLAGSLTYDGTSYSSLAQQLRQGTGAVEIDVECAAGQIDLSFPG